jgi:hypothetical protein
VVSTLLRPPGALKGTLNHLSELIPIQAIRRLESASELMHEVTGFRHRTAPLHFSRIDQVYVPGGLGGQADRSLKGFADCLAVDPIVLDTWILEQDSGLSCGNLVIGSQNRLPDRVYLQVGAIDSLQNLALYLTGTLLTSRS